MPAKKKTSKKRKKAARKKASPRSPKPEKTPKGAKAKGKTVEKRPRPPAKAKKKASRRRRPPRGKVEKRLRVPGTPRGLRRGTQSYRDWELGEVLSRLGTGGSKIEIRAALGMTEDEWRGRLATIREDSRPGDALLVWARFAISTRSRMRLAEKILQVALEPIWDEDFDEDGKLSKRTLARAPNLNAAVGALRLLADLDSKVVEMGLRVGVFQPYDARGDGGPTGPSLSTGAERLIEILDAAGVDGGLDAFGTGDLEAVTIKLRAEATAIRRRPRAPSLSPGKGS